MTIAIIAAFCVVLLVLAFLAPRLSRHVERGGQAPLRGGSRLAHAVPVIGRFLAKPFQHSQKAVSKSGSAGRRGRSRMPL
jgi:hypothetical protein